MPTDISTVVKSAGSRSSAVRDESLAATPVQPGRQQLPEKEKNVPTKSLTEESTDKKLDKIVEDLNTRVQVVRRELHFTFSDNSGRTIISVVDSDTQEVIRQIPSEEVVALSEHFEEHAGLLLREKV